MADAISIQELIDARTDAKTLEEAVNGDAVTTVLSRLGETYPTLSNALNQIDSKLDSADTQIKQGITNLFENGGLPATPFATKALMTASALVDGDYAQVTDDTVNNGLYLKTAGSWVKSGYDPLTQSKSYTDTAKTAAISTAATDATTKANTAKSEAISASATDATTKANTAKSEAIAAAATDATSKANSAKSEAIAYTDSTTKLSNKIVANNNTVKKLVGVASATDYAVTPSVNYLRYGSLNKHSFLLELKPNTTYTVLVNQLFTRMHLHEFDNAVDTWLTQKKPDKYTSLTPPYLAESRRYITFTTSATTNFAVIEFTDYTDFDFIVCQGAYDVNMWESFNKFGVDRVVNTSLLNVDSIITPMFSKSKNLFEAYSFGISANTTIAVGASIGAVYFVTTNYDAVDKKKQVGALMKINPNTTYTISKEPSNRFVVVLKDNVANSGRVIMRDSSLSSYTFTTNSTDNELFIELSNNYEQPKIQIELGSKVTAYESVGLKFTNAALPIGAKLTDRVKQTDNTYITLGTQTDKYYFPTNTPPSYTTATILNDYYEPLVADYPALVTKNFLSKDSSGVHDIFEYVFEPDHYEQTILLTAGMHPTEGVPPFALGILLNEIYRNPSRHEGLAYLRNKVKIVVIPVVNTWAMDKDPKIVLTHYKNANSVNPNRNFPSRWEVNATDGSYNSKGTAPLSEAETLNVYNVLNREKEDLSFYLDLHTGETAIWDSMVYYMDEDDYLRPEVDGVVSMYNDIVRTKFGREPQNEVFDTARATSMYYAWRCLGIPCATVEYGTGSSKKLDNEQTTFYVDQLFNYIHYGLKAQLKKQRVQAERNEHNKQYISLYNTLAGHNELINTIWTYTQWQTRMYDKLGLTRSVVGAASGTYELVKYVHAPVGYKNTVVLSAGLRGMDRKGVTGLGFFAYKLMTDTNPHIVALRNSTRFIFLPCLNPHGFDNAKLTNANSVAPYASFATSTQPESVALRSFIDSESIDLYVDVDSNYTLFNPAKPSGFADLQVIYNSKADTSYQSIFAMLNGKYGVSPSTAANSYSGALAKSAIADYINGKGIAYEYTFFAQFVLPARVTFEGNYIDYGYEPDELAYCSEVLLNSIKLNTDRLSLVKYINQ